MSALRGGSDFKDCARRVWGVPLLHLVRTPRLPVGHSDRYRIADFTRGGAETPSPFC